MERRSLAVLAKAGAVLCAMVGVSLAPDALQTWLLAAPAFGQLLYQRKLRLALSFGACYLLLSLLLYGIRFHGLRMVIFSEFYVLMFFSLMPVFVTAWDLISTPPGELSAALSQIHAPTPVILGMLVVFRFFPTMKAELRGVHQSMKNRRLTGPAQVLCHPAVTCEYVLVPLLLRCLQIADQLSVSAVARPGDGAYRAQRGGKDHAGKNSCGAGAPVPGRNPHPRPESIPGAAAEALLYSANDTGTQFFTNSVSEELLLGLPRTQAVLDRARALLRRFALYAYKDAHPAILSGGQKQRLAIACGLISGREILLLDEPTSGLDGGNMRIIADALRAEADHGKTVLVITHDGELIRACCDSQWKLE